MIDWTWITTSSVAALMAIFSALGIYAALIFFTRLAGLRSFSKMSTFDFPITVAMGSLVATVILTKDPPLLLGVVALAILYVSQFLVSWMRLRSPTVKRMFENRPLLLMAGTEILHESLKSARLTVDDLKSKLREANVIHPSQVRAVVLETSGDISVLHSGPDGPDLHLDLLSDVQGAERLSPDENVG